MDQNITMKAPKAKIWWNKVWTYFSKPQNLILLILGIVLSVTTVVPIITIFKDTIAVHPGTLDTRGTQFIEGYTFFNWVNIITGKLAGVGSVFKIYLWTPTVNTVLLAVFACLFSIAFGGIFAYLVTRTNMSGKKYLSSIFIFPYIMPQWTLAVVWQNLFNSNAVCGTSDGLFASLFNIHMPLWWCQGLFPSALVLGIHYAPFAYMLIGGIFRNMDANLEEAATILDTPKAKIFSRVTLPLVKPAILSTILLVFGGAMGSYPVPHYLGLITLSTKYVEMKASREGQASILAVVMMLFGVVILIMNQITTSGRKNYTTVTGKSGQSSKVNLGKAGKHVIAGILIVLTFFTSIFPILLFALETFLPNPGDYSFLKTFDFSNLTVKWWANNDSQAELGMYGQLGMLHNNLIWRAYRGTILVSVACSLIAGTIGTFLGYAVSKNRKSKWANYVNNIAFLPYLMPSLAVGVAFFTLGSFLGISQTYKLVILTGVIKYIPFASRSSLNSMLQLGGEIEEAAIIQNVPWFKRMFRIIIPIQKSSILSGFLLPFMTCLRELTLFMLLCSQSMLITTMLDYFDEMGLYAFSSGINLILIITILVLNTLVNKLTGASIDQGVGGK